MLQSVRESSRERPAPNTTPEVLTSRQYRSSTTAGERTGSDSCRTQTKCASFQHIKIRDYGGDVGGGMRRGKSMKKLTPDLICLIICLQIISY